MPCYHPITAYRSRSGHTSKGVWPIVFKQTEGYKDKELKIPCGQCIGCRLERSRQWALRLMHEQQMHKESGFLTLTYSDENLPIVKNKAGEVLPSVNKRHIQLFMKKLRKHINIKIRYYQCAEYGTKNKRPHHHAIIYGWEPTDKILISKENEIPLYTSPELEKIWGKGKIAWGELTFDSAAYVARYCVEKINGNRAEKHYNGRMPEYSTMSRRPGIASDWYKKYKNDILNHDTAIINGHETKPPKYYDKILQREDLDKYISVKERRDIERKILGKEELDYKRLETIEKCKRLNLIGRKKRSL